MTVLRTRLAGVQVAGRLLSWSPSLVEGVLMQSVALYGLSQPAVVYAADRDRRPEASSCTKIKVDILLGTASLGRLPVPNYRPVSPATACRCGVKVGRLSCGCLYEVALLAPHNAEAAPRGITCQKVVV